MNKDSKEKDVGEKAHEEKKEEKREKRESKYRRDIDGLRGVAVSAVVIFHFSKSLLPGGFVGVDVFFVISGFLITNIILSEMRDSTFSFSNFYSRRVKRIFPASAACVAAVLVCSYLLFTPRRLVQTAEMSVSALLSSSNMYNCFFVRTEYFADDTRLLPLLHLWSLAVEEQFYFLWPLLMLFLHKLSSTTLSLFTLAAIFASSLLGQVLFFKNPSMAYYLLPTRMGEIMAGSLLCFFQPKISRFAGEMAGMAGMVLVCYSMFFFSEKTVFPGFNALIPCLGTYLLIFAGSFSPKKPLSSKILSFSLLVQIGLVSYSAYLYHWPVLSFAVKKNF